MKRHEKMFDLLTEIMDKFKEVSGMADNLCIIMDAQALGTLTLSLQEKVREEWNNERRQVCERVSN